MATRNLQPVVPGRAAAFAWLDRGQARLSSGEFNAAAHGLRGIASVLVLAAHILGGTARHIYPFEGGYLELIKHPWYFGVFGVEIFFVISGFVILPSAMKYSMGEFAWRRFIRIYPLFFALSILFVLLNYATRAYPHLDNPKTIISGFLFVNLFTGTEQLTPNAWSLSFEICFYVLTTLVVTFAVKKRSPVFGSAALLAAIYFVISFPIAIYFLIGIWLRLTVEPSQLSGPLSRLTEVVSVALVIWFSSRAHFDYTTWAQFQEPVVLPILVTLSTYFSVALRNDSLTARLLDNPVTRYVGDVSYSLYLVHPFAYFGLRMLFVHYGLFTDNVALSMLLFTFAVFVGSFLLTAVAHALLERWPYQKMFHQKVYREKNDRSEVGASS